mgnify:CR=1 FL=1
MLNAVILTILFVNNKYAQVSMSVVNGVLNTKLMDKKYVQMEIGATTKVLNTIVNITMGVGEWIVVV